MKNGVIKTSLIAGLIIMAMVFIRSRFGSTSVTQPPDKLAILTESSPASDEPASDPPSPTLTQEVSTYSTAIPPNATFPDTNSTSSQSAANWDRPASDDQATVPTASETNSPIQLPQFSTNSLGMVFVLVPETRALFSMYDVRVQDYQVFVTATRRDWRPPPFEQGPLHPAVNVSWHDAKAFCAWLTEKEQHDLQNIAAAVLIYRLPTQEEWGIAAGSSDAENALFPWGDKWPPPWGAGNYKQTLKVDAYPYTSPVGVFTPNKYGLYDMWGNVVQWCEYAPGRLHSPPIRGASWATAEPFAMQCSFVTHSQSTYAGPHLGFRLILAVPQR